MSTPLRAAVAAGAALALAATAVVVVRIAGRHPDSDAGSGLSPPVATPSPIGLRSLTGKGSIAAALPVASRPADRPGQAIAGFAGRALPTNQWWTSALTGPWTLPLYAHPMAVRATAGGVEVSGSGAVSGPDTVQNPFQPAIVVGGAARAVKVSDYGAFSVRLTSQLADGGLLSTTLVQGSPLVYLHFHGSQPQLVANGPAVLADDGRRVRVAAGGRLFDVVAPDAGRWEPAGARLRLTGVATDAAMAVAQVPDGADAGWLPALRRGAANPVTTTTASADYDPRRGQVAQQLRVVRERPGGGPFALLPHQQSTLDRTGVTPLAGGYAEPLGTLRLIDAEQVTLRVPMPGLLPGVPVLPPQRTPPITADLAADLAQPSVAGGGSYTALKELGRLATVAELAARVGDAPARQTALARLRGQLVDWLTYTGPADQHYFGYDRAWGGLVAVPAEFGSQDYNDHHFQYGYLVRAAATMAGAEPTFARDYGSVVNLIVADYAGNGTAGGSGAGSVPGLPTDRAFSPYLGHSLASGFAAFADGNNQESSSEAVAAWEAVVRWGLVTGQPGLVATGVQRYALEALTARMYWLGDGLRRPAGYAHASVGVVWDGKIDFATFFDARPEAVLGIQLLPLTFGSLYRAQPAAAAQRAAELGRDIAGPPRIWGDLFAADLAAADPDAALARLHGHLPREPSTGRAMVDSYVALLAADGPPDPTVIADGPYGLALRGPGGLCLLAVNPTGEPHTVVFRRGEQIVRTVRLAPGEAWSAPGTVG